MTVPGRVFALGYPANRGGWLVMARCLIVALAVVGYLAGADAQEAAPEHVLITLLRSEGEAFEHGEGVDKDPQRAVQSYCKAAKLGDALSQFNLAWMYANGRGVDRNDALAAFFFNAAAEQGLAQAQQMLRTVGGPTSQVPECMRDAPSPLARLQPRESQAIAQEIASRAPKTILDLVTKIAPQYRVHPQLALAVIEAESNFNVAALSPKNAKGLMQLIPETAQRFNVTNPYDAAQNIRGGIAYLRWLLAYFEGDVMLVAAAYNAGEGTVDRYRGVPPYVETRDYVRKVLQATGSLKLPFDATATPPSPQLSLIRGATKIR